METLMLKEVKESTGGMAVLGLEPRIWIRFLFIL